MNRKFVVGLLATLLLANASIGAAQRPGKIHRIGFLTNQTASSISSGRGIEAFRQGLRDLGYIEGNNIIIEYRGAGGKHDRMPELVAELPVRRDSPRYTSLRSMRRMFACFSNQFSSSFLLKRH